MPYINKDLRINLDPAAGDQRHSPAATAGGLNYQLTRIIQEYLKLKGELSYLDINDVLGALDACAREFYRRVAVPYEEKAIQRNGDIY